MGSGASSPSLEMQWLQQPLRCAEALDGGQARCPLRVLSPLGASDDTTLGAEWSPRAQSDAPPKTHVLLLEVCFALHRAEQILSSCVPKAVVLLCILVGACHPSGPDRL